MPHSNGLASILTADIYGSEKKGEKMYDGYFAPDSSAFKFLKSYFWSKTADM